MQKPMRKYPMIQVFCWACQGMAGLVLAGSVILAYATMIEDMETGLALFIGGAFLALAVSALGQWLCMQQRMAEDTHVTSEIMLRQFNRKKR